MAESKASDHENIRYRGGFCHGFKQGLEQGLKAMILRWMGEARQQPAQMDLLEEKSPMTGRERASLIGGSLGVIGLLIGIAAAIWA